MSTLSNFQELHVVFGTGVLGKNAARELVRLGKQVRMVDCGTPRSRLASCAVCTARPVSMTKEQATINNSKRRSIANSWRRSERRKKCCIHLLIQEDSVIGHDRYCAYHARRCLLLQIGFDLCFNEMTYIYLGLLRKRNAVAQVGRCPTGRNLTDGSLISCKTDAPYSRIFAKIKLHF